MRYLAVKGKKCELLGKDEWDGIRLQTLSGVIGDVAKAFAKICFTPKESFETAKTEEFQKSILPKLCLLSKSLGDQEWQLGYLTIADFHLGYLLGWLLKFNKDALKDHKNLADLQDRFINLKGVKDYAASDKCPKPFMPPTYATWSGI